ncbi:helix-turn-helix domain-containing protein [Ectobacillus polymachus]|uniref:helix-turn-helix domain-containing protein n=1 Tax=Ectobacillus polymachus TaxID=1508806 RepID=UPI003A8C81E0
MSIGYHIKKIRLEKGLSLTEVASRTGIAKSYLSTIERDLKSNPSIQILEKIAIVLQVDIHTLLNQDKEEAKEPIDTEWLELIKEATELEISKEEFKQFMEFTKWKRNNQQ